MALQKEKTLANGISGDYWKIVEISLNRLQKKARCLISLFKDAAHKDTSPVGPSLQFEFALTDQEMAGDITAVLYAKIKTYANSDIPNIDGNSTRKGSDDLVDAIDA